LKEFQLSLPIITALSREKLIKCTGEIPMPSVSTKLAAIANLDRQLLRNDLKLSVELTHMKQKSSERLFKMAAC
jgi:hypothetical protein